MPNQIISALILALPWFLGGCQGGGSDPQEKISSLRTLGVAIQDPLVTTPSVEGAARKTALVKLYAAVPLGEQATLGPFEESASAGGALAVPVSGMEIVSGSANYDTYNSFRIFTAMAKIAVPTLAELHGAPGQFAGIQLRYGLTVATASEHENVIANILVVPEGAPEVAWSNPTVDTPDFVKNSVVSIGGDIDLNAAVVNPNNESLKVGWFVSNGEVSNRRAEETVWKLKDAGPATVAVVVHGTRSRGFALKVIDVMGQ